MMIGKKIQVLFLLLLPFRENKFCNIFISMIFYLFAALDSSELNYGKNT